ncbi:hypothetical protein SAMN05444170_4794 [Bradyrhizobium erythrophlei]|uniref:Uncharacterized protein n=1 Tax=Bradyrhizobium erythrophlei TaxID=1437360 RepID=A0A1M7UFB0_9BRAD|nr:hypothetical protein SAMN05444170_4794 [Bradyrhizobium erythrophlei]
MQASLTQFALGRLLWPGMASPHGEEARAPEQAELREDVANGASKDAPLDDASRRQENHEASVLASSFETPLARLLRMRVCRLKGTPNPSPFQGKGPAAKASL